MASDPAYRRIDSPALIWNGIDCTHKSGGTNGESRWW